MGMSYSSQFNLNKLRQNLFSKKRAVNAAMVQAVEDGAKQIMEKSKSNAPVDTHNLEEAHHITQGKTRSDNVSFSIEVSGEGFGSEEPRDVEEYAHLMEQGHDEAGNPYGLGDKSLAKAASGHEVGFHFMQRAIESEKPIVIDKIRRAVKRKII